MSLRRQLSLYDATLLIVGNVIGAGIFTTAGFLAGELPHPLLFIGIWLLGGFLTICGALTYAELAAMYPLAGGDYQYLKAAYGRWAGFLLGWLSFWIIGPGSSAALSLAVASYAKPFLALGGGLQEKLLAVGLIALFSVINIRGIRPGGTTQDIMTGGTIVILVVMVLAGLFAGNGSWEHFASPAGGQAGWARLLSTPMIAVIFTFSGWFASAYIGSEIRDPERNLPLSLFLGTLFVTVLYTFMNMMYLYALPLSTMNGAVNVAQLAMEHLFNPSIAGIVSLPIILAIAASINANILTGARVCYAMADDGAFWRPFRKLHPMYNTPHVAILSQTLIASLLVFIGTFDQLLGCVVFVMILSSIAVGLALFVLRRRNPGERRPYRVWGYPLVPAIFTGAYLLIAGQIFFSRPFAALAGIALAISGLPFFFRWETRKRRRDTAGTREPAEQ
jgi:APA family basic amino acid/polyamine antiporter